MKRFNWLAAFLMLAIATAAGAQYFSPGWSGLRIGPANGTAGTPMKLVELHELEFTGDETATATTAIDTTQAWRALVGAKTNSADGILTVGISGTTMTVTSSAATTGSIDVMLIQL